MSTGNQIDWGEKIMNFFRTLIAHIPIIGPMFGDWMRGAFSSPTASNDQPQGQPRPPQTASTDLPAPSRVPDVRTPAQQQLS